MKVQTNVAVPAQGNPALAPAAASAGAGAGAGPGANAAAIAQEKLLIDPLEQKALDSTRVIVAAPADEADASVDGIASAAAGAGVIVRPVEYAEPMFSRTDMDNYPILKDARVQTFLGDKPSIKLEIKLMLNRGIRGNPEQIKLGRLDILKTILKKEGFDVSCVS